MDPRQTPDPQRGTGADEPDGSEPVVDGPGGGDGDRSSGDLLTMSLFGAMVIIASLCFVIW